MLVRRFCGERSGVVWLLRITQLPTIRVAHGVDCGVDAPRFPAALALKPAGQIARIVHVIRDFAGLEGDTFAA